MHNPILYIMGIMVLVILERTFNVLRSDPPTPRQPFPYTEGLDDTYHEITEGMSEK